MDKCVPLEPFDPWPSVVGGLIGIGVFVVLYLVAWVIRNRE